MSPAEILYRGRGSLLGAVQRIGRLTDQRTPAPDLTVSASGDWFTEAPQVDSRPYVQAADCALAGHIPVFALADADLGPIPRWNRDPRTGREAPLQFGKTLDYRDEGLVGDIKYLWEPNRHLQLVTLAQAYRLTRDTRYLDGLRSQLISWMDQCPYLRGPNWTSALELSIRLVNWSIVWRLTGGLNSPLFDGAQGTVLRDRWLASIHQHMHFIAGHFSRYSSSNNHLIGEAAGLFTGACTWPHWPHADAWKAKGYTTLTEEALKQNSADGVNREQAIAYQQFVLDFLLLSALAGKDAGVEFPAAYWGRIESMLEFLASVMDVSGNVPMIGDADDGYVVRLAAGNGFCPYRSLLATGAVLFGRPEFKRKAAALDDKTRWLLGERAVAEFDGMEDAPVHGLPVRTAFPEGGYYILGTDFETAEEIRLVMDCGSLGYLSIAAHGHADALAMTLSVGGREILVDPGTYAYHTMPKWRNYFRGTAAHNTVRIDALDQSEIGGNFMWLHHARARCDSWSSTADVDLFSGSHDGYRRLDDPVIHRRQVRLDKPARTVTVIDTLDCRAAHRVEQFWHFAEECRVRLQDSSVIVENDGVRIRIAPLNGAVQAVLMHGDDKAPGGWISRRYDRKQPAATVVWRSSITGRAALSSRIECIGPPRHPPTPSR